MVNIRSTMEQEPAIDDGPVSAGIDVCSGVKRSEAAAKSRQASCLAGVLLTGLHDSVDLEDKCPNHCSDSEENASTIDDDHTPVKSSTFECTFSPMFECVFFQLVSLLTRYSCFLRMHSHDPLKQHARRFYRRIKLAGVFESGRSTWITSIS